MRERALVVMSSGLEHMMSAREKVARILVPLLKGVGNNWLVSDEKIHKK